MEYVNYPLSQEFNKFYSDVLNCKVVSPPYYPGQVPQSFFFKKRDGFSKTYVTELGNSLSSYTEIYDFEVIELGTVVVFWVLAKSGTNVVLVKVKYDYVSTVRTVTTPHTAPFDASVNYKFLYMPHVRWEGASVPNAIGVVDTFNGSTSSGNLRVSRSDNAAAWATGNYDGLYIYCYDGQDAQSSGIGQVLRVDYKFSSQFLDVTSSGWKVPPVNLRYRMFSDWGTVLAFASTDFLYTIPTYDIPSPSSDLVLAAANVTTPIDVAYANNRLFVLQRNASNELSQNILGGSEGFFALYYGGQSLIGSVKQGYNIAQFQNYLLIMSRESIDTIAQITTTINNVNITLDIIVNVTRDITVFGQNAFTVWNEGLYVVTDNKKFFAVSISSANVYRYNVQLQNQGIYIQKFLDTFSEDDDVRVVIENADVYILRTTDKWTDIFIYDNFYRGWHRWSTQLQIRNKKASVFFGASLYELSLGSLKDDPTGINDGFLQSMEIVSGEDNSFSFKRQFFTKLYIGDKTTEDTLVEFISYAGGSRKKIQKYLYGANYFTQRELSTTEGTYGTHLMGSGLYMVGGESITGFSPIDFIKINTGFSYEICIIRISAADDEQFHIGGVMVGYLIAPPSLTPYKQVI